MTADLKPPPESIQAQLKRILNSAKFRGSNRQKEFLKFIVNETLAGRASRLKGYTIAVEVFGRKENFNPQVDPIVRVEAGRLRRALEHYYFTAGKNDPVLIEIPKGGYVPTFEKVQSQPPDVSVSNYGWKCIEDFQGPSIAIIPLLNLTGTNEQDYFVDGLTEELTAELTRYQEFQVIASQSAMRFKGREVDPQKIGRELCVQFLLTGNIRKDSKTIKVAIKLLETSTGAQIWGKSYKRDLKADDLINLQEEITARIVAAVADQYGYITRRLARESRKKAPADFEAYDAVLRFYHYETVLTPEAFSKALSALEQAVKLDPDYGLAWAMLGHLHADNYALGFCEIEDPLKKAFEFARKGVALSPASQFARDALTLVFFHRSQKDFFLKNAEATISLNPNSPYIVGVAGWHMMLFGEWEHGLKLLKKGIKLNPYHPSWFHLAPYMDHYRRGEYEKAFAESLKFNYPDMFWDPLMRAAALGQMGKIPDAKKAVAGLLELVPDFRDCGRQLINNYVKVPDLVEEVIEGLEKAGMTGIA